MARYRQGCSRRCSGERASSLPGHGRRPNPCSPACSPGAAGGDALPRPDDGRVRGPRRRAPPGSERSAAAALMRYESRSSGRRSWNRCAAPSACGPLCWPSLVSQRLPRTTLELACPGRPCRCTPSSRSWQDVDAPAAAVSLISGQTAAQLDADPIRQALPSGPSADIPTGGAVVRVAHEVDAPAATVGRASRAQARRWPNGLDAEPGGALPARTDLATVAAVAGVGLQVDADAEAFDQSLVGARRRWRRLRRRGRGACPGLARLPGGAGDPAPAAVGRVGVQVDADRRCKTSGSRPCSRRHRSDGTRRLGRSLPPHRAMLQRPQ